MKVELKGFRELDAALAEFSKAGGKAILRRAATKALQPMLERAKQLVPVDEGDLRNSLTIGTRLNKGEARAARREGKSGVEVYMGTNSRNGAPREFGSVRSPAQPFMRPAFESQKGEIIPTLQKELAIDVEKTRARAARKAAKLARVPSS